MSKVDTGLRVAHGVGRGESIQGGSSDEVNGDTEGGVVARLPTSMSSRWRLTHLGRAGERDARQKDRGRHGYFLSRMLSSGPGCRPIVWRSHHGARRSGS